MTADVETHPPPPPPPPRQQILLRRKSVAPLPAPPTDDGSSSRSATTLVARPRAIICVTLGCQLYYLTTERRDGGESTTTHTNTLHDTHRSLVEERDFRLLADCHSSWDVVIEAGDALLLYINAFAHDIIQHLFASTTTPHVHHHHHTAPPPHRTFTWMRTRDLLVEPRRRLATLADIGINFSDLE